MKVNFKNKKIISFAILSAFIFCYEINSANTDAIKQPAVSLIPSGETVGIRINVDGLLVLGVADIKTMEGTKECPALKGGITSGDLIKTINGEKLTSIYDMERLVEKNETCHIVYERQGVIGETNVTPVKCVEDGKKKLGLWVRGSASGIGTLTYIRPDDYSFGALGHPITDADTGDVIKSSGGDLYKAEILGVTRSVRGVPGEIRGAIVDNNDTGDVTSNCNSGIYGKADVLPEKQALETATKDDIKIGDAYILSDVGGNGAQLYSVKITNTFKNSQNKGIVLKVTDQSLINLTGGIVQGMSGSPLIQNGKLIGAVTHVFVNDPTRGYGIFIENMLAEAEKIK